MTQIITNFDLNITNWYITCVPYIQIIGALIAVVAAGGFFVSLIMDNIKSKRV